MNYSSHPEPSGRVVVWDPLVRIFHWSLVACFIITFVTEDDWLLLHSIAGYCISGLLLFRICWGLIGTRYARFSSFVVSPAKVLDYLKSLARGRPDHYLGHNPAGGLMIVVMMVMLLLVSLTGIITLATEGLGPLAGTFFASLSEDLLEEIHEALANLMLLLVIAHIAGVIVSSFVHRENLVRAMFDGRKPARSEESS